MQMTRAPGHARRATRAIALAAEPGKKKKKKRMMSKSLHLVENLVLGAEDVAVVLKGESYIDGRLHG